MSGVTLAFPEALSLEAGAPPGPGPIKLGSDDHKNLFCRTLLTTFDPYKPAVIDWPKLDQETRDKITGLPIWDIAVQTEGKAGLRVATFGELVTDPLLKRAIELDAFEERRHKHVLANMVEAYGIKLEPEPEYHQAQGSRMGLHGHRLQRMHRQLLRLRPVRDWPSARASFPPELVDTFEPVMKEEGRHILFFVNWVAWYRRNMPLWRRPWFALKILGVWAFLI